MFKMIIYFKKVKYCKTANINTIQIMFLALSVRIDTFTFMLNKHNKINETKIQCVAYGSEKENKLCADILLTIGISKIGMLLSYCDQLIILLDIQEVDYHYN